MSILFAIAAGASAALPAGDRGTIETLPEQLVEGVEETVGLVADRVAVWLERQACAIRDGIGALVGDFADTAEPEKEDRIRIYRGLPTASRSALSGLARVVDGDTLDVAGARVRLHGIDAPESAQRCRASGRSWPCGREAARALASRIGDQRIFCEERDRDGYGRVVAVCAVAGLDLNEWMVSEGWAFAYRRYSRDYVAAESRARAARRGIWRGEAVAPWEWRRGRRLPGSAPAARRDGEGCRIKGNIGGDGMRIYHVPGGQYYGDPDRRVARRALVPLGARGAGGGMAAVETMTRAPVCGLTEPCCDPAVRGRCVPPGPGFDRRHGIVPGDAEKKGRRLNPVATAMAAVSLLVLAGCGGGGGEDRPDMADPTPMSEVRVIDADTVDVDGVRYRLHGIDAPEARQTCRAWGRSWDCGAAATEALMSRAEGMSCAGGDTDAFGRTIGICSAGGVDLNAWLVANGWALAYRQFSRDYVDEEGEARSNRRGIHRGAFVAPWDWRRGERLEGEDRFAAIVSEALDVDALADRMLRGDDGDVYGRWLDHSVFAVVDGSVAVSFGDFPATDPTPIGGGVWRGALVGIDGATRERIEGDAEIAIDDFTRPDIDIALTGIRDAGGRARADLLWRDIPMARGHFQARDMVGGSVEGRFYGPDHGEVGGIFRRDRLVGAFGGSR